MARSFEHCIELWGSIQCTKRPYCLSNYWLISRDFAPRSFLATVHLLCCDCQLISTDTRGRRMWVVGN